MKIKVCIATLALIALFSSNLLAKNTIREIQIKDIQGGTTHTRSIIELPKVYQCNQEVSIQLPKIVSYSNISTTNIETGEQIYCKIYAGVYTIQIDLTNEETGIYILQVEVNSKRYEGTFTL
jgi:hypothetical protein